MMPKYKMMFLLAIQRCSHQRLIEDFAILNISHW